MRVFFSLSALVGLTWLALCLVSGPTPRLAKPDSPLAAARFRLAQRLDEKGMIPEGALMNAIHQREALISPTDGAGVYPGGWSWLGPGNIGGRVREILINPTNTNIMWTGGLSGGIWKTTNGGATWAPMDDFLPVLGVSCMALDPLNPDILYVGTGEGFFEAVEGSSNTAAVRGAGVFKSTDGGVTWNQLASTNNPSWYFVNRLAICPSNPNLIVAACSSGIYRSTDAGNSWSQVGAQVALDMQFHPTDPLKLVAGTHELGALFSNDGGMTWNQATGLGAPHRTEVRYARSSPTVVFASVSQSNIIKIYRSTDGGQNFVLRTTGSGISTYEAYNNVLWVDPTNPNTLIVGGVNLYRSTDAGATLPAAYGNVHADQHAIVSDPAYNGSTNRRIFFGCDGGVYRANDATSNTVTALNNNLGITQFYGAVLNPATNVMVGGTQDNGTKRYAGNAQGWTTTFGGDGGFCAYDPTNSNYYYGEIYYAQVFRSTNGGTSGSYVYSGIGDAGSAATCNFIPFFMLDPNNANRMIMGARQLWRSNNIKATTPSWTSIKPTIDPGDSIEKEAHFADNPPYNISTMAIAPTNSDIIWVGYNNGQVWKTLNGTASIPTWSRVDDGNGPMPARWVSTITIHPTDPNRVYVAFMGYADGNVWRTTNGGGSFTEISGAVGSRLPSAPVSAFNVHATRAGWLYAGTEVGLFTSDDDGDTWSTMTQGPGVVPIEQLHWVTPTQIMAVTHGRGCYLATVDPNSDPVSPEAFTVIRGSLGGGVLNSLFGSDDRRLSVNSNNSGNDVVSPAALRLEATAPLSTVTQLILSWEVSTTLPGLGQTVYLFDYQAGTWQFVSGSVTTASDSTSQVTITANPSRFIDPVTRKMRAVLSWDVGSSDSEASWTANVDQVLWKLTPP